MIKDFGSKLLGAAVIASAIATSANANTINLYSTGVSLSGSTYTYTYDVVITTGSTLTQLTSLPYSPSGVTVYDFAQASNAVFSSAASTLFTTSISPTGGFFYPQLANPAAIIEDGTSNVSLAYAGGGVTGSVYTMSVNSVPVVVGTKLGTLSIDSTVGTALQLNVTSSDVQPTGTSSQGSFSTTFGASQLAGATPVVLPLPGAVAGGTALLGAIGIRRLRRRATIA